MRLKIKYQVPESLMALLLTYGNSTEQEVWCNIQDITKRTFERLIKKPNQRDSWSYEYYPGTKCKLRISVYLHNRRMRLYRNLDGTTTSKHCAEPDELEGTCRIKFANSKDLTFTSEDVEKILVDKILLGIED